MTRTSGVASDGASRVRRVVLRWYPADGSLAMAEEEARNDGLARGGYYLLKRSVVPGVAARHVRVGAALLVAARTFTLYWCDERTRAALVAADAAAGAPPQPPNFEPPPDAFARKLAAEAAAAAQWHGHQPSGMARFVEDTQRGCPKPLRLQYEAAPPLRFLLRWVPPPLPPPSEQSAPLPAPAAAAAAAATAPGGRARRRVAAAAPPPAARASSPQTQTAPGTRRPR